MGAEPLKVDTVGNDLVGSWEVVGDAVHRSLRRGDPGIELGVKMGEDGLTGEIAEVGGAGGVKGADIDRMGMEKDHQGKHRGQGLVEVDDIEAFTVEKGLDLIGEKGGQGDARGGAIGGDREGHSKFEEVAVIVFGFVVGAGGEDTGVVTESLELVIEFSDMRVDAARIAEIERGHEEDSHQHPREIALRADAAPIARSVAWHVAQRSLNPMAIHGS